MSLVSTVVLFTSSLDSDWEDQMPGGVVILQERLEAAGIGRLGDLDGDHWGGSKSPQMGVYGGAYNYLDTEVFLRLVAATPWNAPENIVVVIDCEKDTDPAVWRLTRDGWRG